MAARLRSDLGVPVDEQEGAYGEFTVLVDDDPVIGGGAFVWIGFIPSVDQVLEKVRARLAR